MLTHTYEEEESVIFLIEENIFSVKEAVTNVTECGCMKSPVPTISCRSLQHMLCTCGKDWLVFPLYFYDQKMKEYCSSLSLSTPSVCVGGCVCVWGWVHVCKRRQRARERERERERRGGGPEGLQVGRDCMNSLTLSSSHYPAPSPSPHCTFTFYNWSTLWLKGCDLLVQ